MANNEREDVNARIQNSFEKYGWTPKQQERFKEFVEERYANYSNPANTVLGYLAVLNHVVERYKKPFSEITVEDLFPILQEWQENSPATVHGWRAKLRAFLRWESRNKHDGRAEKIKAGTYVSPITQEDLLTEEEIQILREGAKANPRDLAMLDFHLLWGPRPSESASLTVGSVKVVENRYIVVNIPQTKTTYRPVPIPLTKASVIQDTTFLDSALNAYISLRKYLDIHPGYPDEPAAPLWYDTNKNYRKRLAEEGVTAVFRRLGRSVGLEKTVTTYVLRRTAFNRFKGADREKLNAGFGWKPGSRMPTTVYNKLRPQDVLGTLVKDEEEEPRNINVCSGCHRENPKDQTFCVWCGTPLVELPATATLNQFHADQKAQDELNELRRKLTKVEGMLSAMRESPMFRKMLEEAAEKVSG